MKTCQYRHCIIVRNQILPLSIENRGRIQKSSLSVNYFVFHKSHIIFVTHYKYYVLSFYMG